jgi:hypothetical protein
MMSAFGKDPNARMQTQGQEQGRRGDDAQMMSRFGQDVNAQMMTSSKGQQPGQLRPTSIPAHMMSSVSGRDSSDATLMDTSFQTGTAVRPASQAPARDMTTQMMSSFGSRDMSDAAVMDTMYRAQAVAEQEPQVRAMVRGQIARPEAVAHAGQQFDNAEMMSSFGPGPAPQATVMNMDTTVRGPGRQLAPPGGDLLRQPTATMMMSEVGAKPGVPDALLMDMQTSFAEGARQSTEHHRGRPAAGGVDLSPAIADTARIDMMSDLRESSDMGGSDIVVMDSGDSKTRRASGAQRPKPKK